MNNTPIDTSNNTVNFRPVLPHHRLRVYGMALEMLVSVRDEALRAAKGACLNIAEGAARVTRADKARAFTIARGEIVEACAALEIAVLLDSAREEDAQRVVVLADRIVVILTRLIR